MDLVVRTTAKLLRRERQCASFPIINIDIVGLLIKVQKHNPNVTYIPMHTVMKRRYGILSKDILTSGWEEQGMEPPSLDLPDNINN